MRVERRVRSDTVVDSPWLGLSHDEVVDDSGLRSDYWLVHRGPFVLVIPRDEQTGDVCLVRRYRYPLDEWFWEFPQARFHGLAPEAAESTGLYLLSEIGLTGIGEEQLTFLGRFFEAYGFSDHQCLCYLGEFSKWPGEAPGIETTRMSLAAIQRSPSDAGVYDAASIAAITLLAGYLGT